MTVFELGVVYALGGLNILFGVLLRDVASVKPGECIQFVTGRKRVASLLASVHIQAESNE